MKKHANFPNSSNVVCASYENGTLTIEFISGTYEYYNVPESEFSGLKRAVSAGTYVHNYINGRYQYRRIK